MNQPETTNEAQQEDYPVSDEQVIDMLHDLSSCQGGIISKLEELHEVDCGRNAELKASLEKILNEVKANSETASFSLADKEEKEVSTLPKLYLTLGLTHLIIILGLTLGIYSIKSLIDLNMQWENKLKEKMHEAMQLDRVIDLFNKQKEEKGAAR